MAFLSFDAENEKKKSSYVFVEKERSEKEMGY